MIIEPRIEQRSFSETLYTTCLNLGLSELQARIAAARLDETDDIEKVIFPRLQHLQPLQELHQAEVAGELIADTILQGGHIAIATDYDADGVTSAWVIETAFKQHFHVPDEQFSLFLNARTHGYGLNDTLVDQILAQHARKPIALVITADQGGSDELRIARLKAAGIKVCVTDHHQLPPEGPPASADCVINPQQSICQYDKNIAGCMVAFLVMSQVRQALIRRGHLPTTAPSLKDLLPKVALGTIADAVSLKSPNNRAIVHAGLKAINQLSHPVWQAVQRFTRSRNWMDEEFLAFEVATRINAASRVNDVSLAREFLNAPTPEEALEKLKLLDKNNQYRKQQQQTLLAQAQKQAESLVASGCFALSVVVQGTPGIQGIVAQRIGEQFGRPTVAFTDLEDGTLAGSGRAIAAGLDLYAAFAWMQCQSPELFISQGGHASAAGCMIPKAAYPEFAQGLEDAVRAQLGETVPQRVLETDGPLNANMLHPGLLQELSALAPYGQGWPHPTFDNHFEVVSCKAVGADKTHLTMTLRMEDSGPLSAIYFSGQLADQPLRFEPGQRIRAVYRPTLSTFAGRQQFQLRILWAG